MNPLASVPSWASGLVTVTVTGPTAPGGETAVIRPAERTCTPVAADPPKSTVAPVWNALPSSVTGVPPAVGPPAGVTEASVGAGGGPLR